MNDAVAILLIFLLLLGNAFFVGAEFALISSRRDKLEALLEQGKNRARIVLNAERRVPLMLSGAQLGITICSLLLLHIGEPAVANQLETATTALGLPLPAYLVRSVAFTVTLIALTLLHVLIGEMVPKNLAIAEPERLALWLVPVHVAWVRVVNPFIRLFNSLANALLRVIRVKPRNELGGGYTSDELAALLSESRREGLLEQSEHRRLSQALSSAGKTVADVLIPLEDLTTLPASPCIGDVEQAVSSTGFSRFPLRNGDGYTLSGYIHVKDVLGQMGGDPDTVVPTGKTRKLTALPLNARLDEALQAMQREGSHLAMAIGSTRSTAGTVALEDLVEEYVGTVRDGTHVIS